MCFFCAEKISSARKQTPICCLRGEDDVLTVVAIAEVSCEFSRLPLNMNFHRLHSNATNTGSKWRLEPADESYVSDVAAAEPSKQSLNLICPGEERGENYDFLFFFCGLITHGWQGKEGNPQESAHGSDQLALPGLGNCITVADSAKSNLKLDDIKLLFRLINLWVASLFSHGSISRSQLTFRYLLGLG